MGYRVKLTLRDSEERRQQDMDLSYPQARSHTEALVLAGMELAQDEGWDLDYTEVVASSVSDWPADQQMEEAEARHNIL